MSITGLAASPGMDVEPTCSIRSAEEPSTARKRCASSSKRTGQLASYSMMTTIAQLQRRLTTERSAARAHDAGIEFERVRAGRLQRFVRRRLSWARSRMPMKDKDCEERNEPATLSERGLAAIQSPRKPNGLSHCIFECLIVEASSQAQNHLSVLADRYTERCRRVFDCTRDGSRDNFGSGWASWPRRFGIDSGTLLPKSGVVGRSLVRLDRFDARSHG